MSSSTRPATSRPSTTDVARSSRPPVTVVTAAALQLLVAAVTTFGVFYFGLIDSAKPPLAVGLAMVAGYWSVNAVGVAGSIGLLRRRALGRTVLVGYGVFEFLFSLAKILIWHESPAYLFATLSLVLIALATAPATRRYAR
jgi:hypothetical protein